MLAALVLSACSGDGATPTAAATGTPTPGTRGSGGGGLGGMTWLWVLVLVAAIWTAHWGAEHLAKPLKKLRRMWGFREVAGAAFVGLCAASPEIGINITSALRGVSDIGLGAAFGSNVLAIPLVVTTAYWSSRKANLGEANGQNENADNENEKQPANQKQGKKAKQSESAGGDHPHHEEHRKQHLLRVKRGAVTIQAIPYLLVIALVALLTLPAGWRGLQPIDAGILLVAYIVYLAQALWRGRSESEDVDWSKKEIALAVGGVVALAVGTYFTVRATENIVSAFGISHIVGGLFITATMAALPEIFAVRSVTRSGQVTAATTSVIGDHVVTLTLALIPLALITMPVDDLQLFATVLTFVAIMPVAYAALIYFGSPEHGFKLWQVILLDAIYIIFVAIMVFWVLNIF
jgi:cation:H+ antiporter